MISIIIPTYNREKYIEETVASFMNQSIQDFEIIFVDGGSKDGTVPYLKDLCGRDKRCRLILKDPNLPIGPSSSRNLAIAVSRGDYICFADDDDLQHPQSLEFRLSVLEKDENLLYVSCNKINFVEEDELPVDLMKSNYNHGIFSAKDVDDYVSNKIWMNTASPLIRRRFFLDNKYREDLYYGDDWEFNLRLLASGTGIQLPHRLIYHRMHPSSTTVTVKSNKPRFESGLKSRIYGYTYLKEKNLLSNSIEKAMLSHFIKANEKTFLYEFIALSSFYSKKYWIKWLFNLKLGKLALKF